MKIVKYGAVLIGIYLGVNYFSGVSSDAKSIGSAGGTIINSLQGKTV